MSPMCFHRVGTHKGYSRGTRVPLWGYWSTQPGVQHILMPPKKVPFLHIYFIAFFDGVCGADLSIPLFGVSIQSDLVDRNATWWQCWHPSPVPKTWTNTYSCEIPWRWRRARRRCGARSPAAADGRSNVHHTKREEPPKWTEPAGFKSAGHGMRMG